MSYKTEYKIEGFYEYVVPPLEGFWWQENVDGADYTDKASFNWIFVIRLPDFVTKKDFEWAVETASEKKKLDCSAAEFLTIDEGLCVQIMHTGPFDNEPASVALMDKYLAENGYANDITDTRQHHEIYMTDARQTAPGNTFATGDVSPKFCGRTERGYFSVIRTATVLSRATRGRSRSPSKKSLRKQARKRSILLHTQRADWRRVTLSQQWVTVKR